MWWRIRTVGDTRTGTGVGPSFVDLVVLKGNLRPSSHLHRILDATVEATQIPLCEADYSQADASSSARPSGSRHVECVPCTLRPSMRFTSVYDCGSSAS